MGRPKKSSPVETPVSTPAVSPTPEKGKKKDMPAATSKPSVVENLHEDDGKKGEKRGRLSLEEESASGVPLVSPSVQERPKKRGRPVGSFKDSGKVAIKKQKLSLRHNRGSGQVLAVGQGDTGQLGLGEDIMERGRPALVQGITDAVDVVAGGMHSVVLDKEGQVWTFGCNDEGSLGRLTADEEECFVPGKVSLPGRVVCISAGDSHSAALTEDGEVYGWGTFRDSSGPIGFVQFKQLRFEPVRLLPWTFVTKIASGADHLAMLSSEGDVFTMGNSEQGQLGRVSERQAHRGGRRGTNLLLLPSKMLVTVSTKFSDVWAGSYNTIGLTTTGQVYVCGLNNYSQLALPSTDSLVHFMPILSPSIAHLNLSNLGIGQHHAILLDGSGSVSALGRAEYGRLGLGEDSTEDAAQPKALESLPKCDMVACGSVVSYAVTQEGHCYSWGMGTNGQLGMAEEDDLWEPTLMKSKQLEGRKVIAVSSGGQHTIMIAKDA